jgi:hypothetical protein
LLVALRYINLLRLPVSELSTLYPLVSCVNIVREVDNT